jgi:hypothetical protein
MEKMCQELPLYGGYRSLHRPCHLHAQDLQDQCLELLIIYPVQLKMSHQHLRLSAQYRLLSIDMRTQINKYPYYTYRSAMFIAWSAILCAKFNVTILPYRLYIPHTLLLSSRVK